MMRVDIGAIRASGAVKFRRVGLYVTSIGNDCAFLFRKQYILCQLERLDSTWARTNLFTLLVGRDGPSSSSSNRGQTNNRADQVLLKAKMWTCNGSSNKSEKKSQVKHSRGVPRFDSKLPPM